MAKKQTRAKLELAVTQLGNSNKDLLEDRRRLTDEKVNLQTKLDDIKVNQQIVEQVQKLSKANKEAADAEDELARLGICSNIESARMRLMVPRRLRDRCGFPPFMMAGPGMGCF